MPASGGKYAGGVFTVPGSTGNYSVTGLDFQPQVVLFFGSNQTDEDTLVVGGVASVMRGVMAWDDVTDSIVSWCFSIVPHSAVRWEQKPLVSCLNGSAGTDYEATAVSLNGDGFTVNFTTVPGSTRKVHYVAIGNMNHSTAAIVTGRAAYTINWEPFSGLHIGSLDDTTLDPKGANAEASDWGHMVTMGGAGWPDGTTTALSNESMLISCVDTPFSDQDFVAQAVGAGNTAFVGVGCHFLGPFLISGSHEQYPIAGGDVRRDVDSNNQGHFTELDAYSGTGTVNPAASAPNTVTITCDVSEVQTPALIIFYGVCDTPLGASTGNTNAISMGFWTEDHQYGVSANGRDDSFFQSEQYAVVDHVTGSGVHAASVAALGTPGAVLTTVEDGIASSNMVWHMFGPTIEDFVPQFYRLLPGGSIAAITVPPQTGAGQSAQSIDVTITTDGTVTPVGFLLLETGDKLILEDGAGFLLL